MGGGWCKQDGEHVLCEHVGRAQTRAMAGSNLHHTLKVSPPCTLCPPSVSHTLHTRVLLVSHTQLCVACHPTQPPHLRPLLFAPPLPPLLSPHPSLPFPLCLRCLLPLPSNTHQHKHTHTLPPPPPWRAPPAPPPPRRHALPAPPAAARSEPQPPHTQRWWPGVRRGEGGEGGSCVGV